MLRYVMALLALATLGACAVSNPHTYSGEFTHPPAHSHIVVMSPDIQLGIMTAGGVVEPREDWSNSSRDNLAAGLQAYIGAHGYVYSALDPNTAMQGRSGQIIRLHEVVGQSIMMMGMLPTKAHSFEWTLGPGVQEVATAQNADYALFVTGRGSYASGGRYAAMIGLAMFGVSVPMGGQQAFASLVDLHTGNVIWFNSVLAGPDQDMRDPHGAQLLVTQLMDKAPL